MLESRIGLRQLIASLIAALFTFPGRVVQAANSRPSNNSTKPNIVLILADDLGYSELGCYGQQKIRTPNIDRLAAEGMRFTQFYAGSTVCAPSRCTLLTGLHTGHTVVRDNQSVGAEGQWPLPARTLTLGNILQDRGYATACIGKWGLGGPGSTGEPNRHGFDYFYGHLCQAVAHNHYTDHLWRNTKMEVLDGNAKDKIVGAQYAPDLMADDALRFIRENSTRPFFLYFATPLPHLALQAPPDAMKPYLGKWDDPPYDGKRGYFPQPHPRATYAAMVTRIDDYVGRIMALLKELKLDENTIVLFASDNGPTFVIGGADSAFFHSANSFRGLKEALYEGGIRVPLIARWPGRIAPGTTTGQPAAIWDLLPTLAQIAGARSPAGIDGISLAPTLLHQGEQPQHEYFYWEYHADGGSQAVRMGNWKAVRHHVKKQPNAPIELYDLATDVGERHDVAAAHPDVVAHIQRILAAARIQSDNPRWRF